MSPNKLLPMCFGLLAACQLGVENQSLDTPDLEPFAFQSAPRAVAPMTPTEARAVLARAVEPGESLLDQDVSVRTLATGEVIIEGTAVSDTDARRITLDASGAAIDRDAALARHRAAQLAQLGKLQPQLFDAVMAGGEHQVLIQLAVDVPELEIPTDAAPDDVERFEQMMEDHRARVRQAIAATAAPVTEWLEANGASDVATLENIPFVSARADAQLLSARFLHDDPAVQSIGFDIDATEALQPLQAHAGIEGGMRARLFTGGACGGTVCRGIGLRAAVWEQNIFSGTGDIGWHNPRMYYTGTPPHIFRGDTCQKQSDCGVGEDMFCLMTSGPNKGDAPDPGETGRCINRHTSTVAYMIGAAPLLDAHEQDGGVWADGYGAYRTNLLVANQAGTGGLDWAVSHGALYVNRSQLTASESMARSIDWAVRNQYVTLTAGSGNNEEAYASPRHSYNAISVGAYDQRDWKTQSDDVMAFFSTYLNDPATGLERPHLVAPGFKLEVPSICTKEYKGDFFSSEDWMSDDTCDGFSDAWSGTSFASPAALGMVIQTHHRAGLFSPLLFPGMRKAVLMAGSQDVAGDGEVTVAGVDSKDGAGAIDMYRVRQILDKTRYKVMNLEPSDFGLFFGGKQVTTVKVPAGYGLRAVMVQNSCPDATTNELTADLDLWITHVPSIYVPGTPKPPSSCFAGRGSVSSVNEFEMVMQDCLRSSSVSNTFAIEIRKKSGTSFSTCGGASTEPVYVAWDLVKLPSFFPGKILW